MLERRDISKLCPSKPPLWLWYRNLIQPEKFLDFWFLWDIEKSIEIRMRNSTWFVHEIKFNLWISKFCKNLRIRTSTSCLVLLMRFLWGWWGGERDMIQSLPAVYKPRELKLVFMQDFKKHNLIILCLWSMLGVNFRHLFGECHDFF